MEKRGKGTRTRKHGEVDKNKNIKKKMAEFEIFRFEVTNQKCREVEEKKDCGQRVRRGRRRWRTRRKGRDEKGQKALERNETLLFSALGSTPWENRGETYFPYYLNCT